MRKISGVVILAVAFLFTLTPNTILLADSEILNNSTVEFATGDDSINITPFGLSKPPKDKKVNLKSGPMSFEGVASGSKLYTNNNFTGQVNVYYNITNNHDNSLKVRVYNQHPLKPFAVETITVPGNTTKSGLIQGLDPNDLYYITFDAPSDFSGYVS